MKAKFEKIINVENVLLLSYIRNSQNIEILFNKNIVYDLLNIDFYLFDCDRLSL